MTTMAKQGGLRAIRWQLDGPPCNPGLWGLSKAKSRSGCCVDGFQGPLPPCQGPRVCWGQVGPRRGCVGEALGQMGVEALLPWWEVCPTEAPRTLVVVSRWVWAFLPRDLWCGQSLGLALGGLVTGRAL